MNKVLRWILTKQAMSDKTGHIYKPHPETWRKRYINTPYDRPCLITRVDTVSEAIIPSEPLTYLNKHELRDPDEALTFHLGGFWLFRWKKSDKSDITS